jgi:hypothetical protein
MNLVTIYSRYSYINSKLRFRSDVTENTYIRSFYIAIGLSTEPIGCAKTLYDITFHIFFGTFVSFIFLFFYFFYQGSTENHFREWTPWLNIVIIIIIINGIFRGIIATEQCSCFAQLLKVVHSASGFWSAQHFKDINYNIAHTWLQNTNQDSKSPRTAHAPSPSLWLLYVYSW